MATVIRTNFPDILSVIRARIAELEIAPLSSVIVSALPPEDVPHGVGEHDVLLTPQDEQSDEDTSFGGGRYDTRASARLHVIPRSRLALDESARDLARLTHSTLGHYALRDSLRDALHLVWPEDGLRNALGVQPPRWIRTGAPKRDRREKGESVWVYSVMEFLIVYPVDLDLTQQ